MDYLRKKVRRAKSTVHSPRTTVVHQFFTDYLRKKNRQNLDREMNRDTVHSPPSTDHSSSSDTTDYLSKKNSRTLIER
jgi:hypothetical protein